MRNSKGQTTLILILLTAVALMFYAVSLNWGKIAQAKTMTMVASNLSAAQTASSYASYGQNLIMSTLGGNTEKKGFGGWLVIAILIVVIVVLIIVTGGGAIVLLITLVMLIISLGIQLVYIEPKLTSLWNKMQQNLSAQDQFLEGGITTGVQNLVTDQIQVADYFDMDLDGRFAKKEDATPDDKISRFAFYYTERLKSIQTSDIEGIKKFVQATKDLIYGTSSNPFFLYDPKNCSLATVNAMNRCNAVADPEGKEVEIPAQCNECCVPRLDGEPKGHGDSYQAHMIRPGPDFCPYSLGLQADFPEACKINNPQFSLDKLKDGDPDKSTYAAKMFPFAYDPNFEESRNTIYSFREKLGRDYELMNKKDKLYPDNIEKYRGFYRDVATGAFQFLWDMDKLNVVGSPTATYGSRSVDNITSFGKELIASDDKCVLTGTNDILWKRGADRFCAQEIDTNNYPNTGGWPYYTNCKKHKCANTIVSRTPAHGTVITQQAGDDCGYQCSANSKYPWPEDQLDNIVYGLDEFISWSKGFLKTSGADLQKSFTEWYPHAADWIAPKCDQGSNDVACNPEDEGRLRIMRNQLGGWQTAIDTQLNQLSSISSTAWCVPNEDQNGLEDWQKMSGDEINKIKGVSTWGSLSSVIACLDYNVKNKTKFEQCQTASQAFAVRFAKKNTLTETEKKDLKDAVTEACAQLPRSLVENFNARDFKMPAWTDNGLGSAAPDSTFQINLAKSIVLAGPQGEQFSARSAFLSAFKQNAQTTRDTFKEGQEAFSRYLGAPDEKCEGISENDKDSIACQLMKARRAYTNKPLEPLGDFIIYGWQDAVSKRKGDVTRLWHLVKVESKVPGRCGEYNCVAAGLPKVKTKTGMIYRTYKLVQHEGRTKTIVTKWDQERFAALSFNNKSPIWQFIFNRKGQQPGTINLNEVCAGMASDWKKIGISEETASVLKNEIKIAPTPNNSDPQFDTWAALHGAFMINRAPRTNDERVCYDAVEALLTQGLSTTTCARYGLGGVNGKTMVLNYVKCQ